jgi:hypothetical protein
MISSEVVVVVVVAVLQLGMKKERELSEFHGKTETE